MILSRIKMDFSDPLYKNSIYLVLSRFLNIGGGFFFWIIAAKFYSIEDIGLSTALISSVTTIILISILGFDFSLIRFIHSIDKNKVYTTTLTITTMSSLLIGTIYITFIEYISPKLYFIKNPLNAFIFVFFVAINSVFLVTGNTFKAIRKTNYFFIQNIFLNLRIPLLIPFIVFGSVGIFYSFGFASFISSLFALLYLKEMYNTKCVIDTKYFKTSFKFSFANYISNFLDTLPILIFPILILNLLGEAEAAKFSIAFAIGNLSLIISDSLNTSLFVEGSRGENIGKNVAKSLLVIYLFLIPTVLIIYLSGGYILSLYGKEYIEAFSLLKVLSISSFFVSLVSLYIPIQNVEMNIGNIVKLNMLKFTVLMVLSYTFILRFGTIGVGYAWLVTYIILSGYVIYIMSKTYKVLQIVKPINEVIEIKN